MKKPLPYFCIALCVLLTWTVCARASLQDGLVAFYPFNGNANDASGNGHNGSVNGATLTTDRFDNPSSAYHFNGSSNYISIPSSSALNLTNDLTIACWIRPAVQGNGFMIFSKHDAASNSAGTYWLDLQGPNGTACFQATPYFDPNTASTSVPAAGSWTQITFTYETSSNVWKFYYNGLLDSSGTRIYNIQQTNIDALIGAEHNSNVNPPIRSFFNGDLDDIRIYNRVLSSEEIVALTGLIPPAGPQPALPIFTVAGSTPPAILTTARAKGKLVYPLGGSFDPNKAMTIVLTHGWTSSSGAWPADMAAALKYSGYDKTANIIAWDWQDNANPGGTMPTSNSFKYAANLALATSMTSSEGRALGVALIGLPGLGSKPVHFMGHSLGTLVNCAAADYLHGDSPGSPPNTTKNPPVQMTLFDEAELAQAIHGIAELADILYKPQRASEPTGSLSAKVLPSHYQWADNYVSLVGLLHPKAANLMAWLEVYHLDSAAHGYAYQWYEGTVTTPNAASLSAMGHYWSLENNTLSRSDLPALGSLFKQSTAPGADPNTVTELPASDEASFRLYGVNTLALPSLLAYDGSYAVANTLSSAVANAVQYGGTVSGSIIQAFTPVNAQPVYIGSADSTPGYFSTPASPPPVYQANWNLQLSIGTQSGAANLNRKTSVNTLATRPPAHTLTTADGASPSFVVMPVSIPSTAVGMTFDYEFNTAGPDDFMTMGIQDDNYFLMEAVNAQDNTWNTTPVIDVSGYAGQTVQFTFVLNNASGDSPVGTMQVRGVQFYKPPAPTLKLQITGGQASVSWPLSAVNWTLELNTDLSDANGWHAVSGTPTDANYFHTINFDIGSSTKAFFRLEK